MSDENASPHAHVLLVEDNEDHAELTREALDDSRLSISVHVVPDGISALAFLRRSGPHRDAPRPDLVLLDWNLPLMDGRDVLKAVKTDPTLGTIPVVVLTMSEDERDIRLAYEMHANCFITKPVDFLEFAAIIKQIVAYWLQSAKLPAQRNELCRNPWQS